MIHFDVFDFCENIYHEIYTLIPYYSILYEKYTKLEPILK